MSTKRRIVRYQISLKPGEDYWFSLPVDSSFLEIVTVDAVDYLIALVGASSEMKDCGLLCWPTDRVQGEISIPLKEVEDSDPLKYVGSSAKGFYFETWRDWGAAVLTL